jgi:ectoine hydroxylase-related dioxygenase (phytanoyl-CoA dioxygenase family)
MSSRGAVAGPARHHLNDGFTWISTRPPFQYLSERDAAAFDELGYVVIADAFDPETLAAVIGEIDPVEQELEETLRRSAGGRAFIARADEITFTTHLAARSDLLRRFVRSPVLAGLCLDLVGPDVRLYWDQAVYKKPGTAAPFPWHQDNGYAFVEPQQYLTCWIALTDATEENGCPWVVPGLHRAGTLHHRLTDTGLVCLEDPDAVAVPAAAGSIVVFSSLTPHCTGPNTTATVRKAYIVQYAPAGAYTRTDAGDVPCDHPKRQFAVLRDGRPV